MDENKDLLGQEKQIQEQPLEPLEHDSPDGNETPRGPQNSKERFYDKLPFTYRQVDIFLKLVLVLIAIVLIVGIATAQ